MKKIILILTLIQMTVLLRAQSFEYMYSTADDEVIMDAAQEKKGFSIIPITQSS
jgi:hypothetical protein